MPGGAASRERARWSATCRVTGFPRVMRSHADARTMTLGTRGSTDFSAYDVSVEEIGMAADAACMSGIRAIVAMIRKAGDRVRIRIREPAVVVLEL